MWTEQAISAYLGEHFWFVNQEGRTVDRYEPPSVPKQKVKRPSKRALFFYEGPKERDAELIELRAQGKNWREIAAHFGCSKFTCRIRYSLLVEQGLTKRFHRKYVVDSLPKGWREIVQQRRAEGCTWADCAEGFNIKVDTLRKLFCGYGEFQFEQREAA